MPNIEDWQIDPKGQTGNAALDEFPRIAFGGQGSWLPLVTPGVGRGTIDFRESGNETGGAKIQRRDTDTRGFPSGRLRAHLYIGPNAVADSDIAADLDLKFYIQTAGDVGGIIARITTFVDRYEVQLLGQDTTGNLEAITDQDATAFTALTEGDFIGWEVKWESSADPAINPNPVLQVKVSYFLTEDWLTPIPVQLACVDYSLPMWESFYSPIVYGFFLGGPGSGIFLGIATPIWSGGVLKGYQNLKGPV